MQLKLHLGVNEPLTCQEKAALASHPLGAEAGSMTASQQARHVGSWRPGGEKQEKDEEHPSAQVFTADDSTIHHDTSRSLSGRGPEIHRSDSLSKTPSHASCTPTR